MYANSSCTSSSSCDSIPYNSLFDPIDQIVKPRLDEDGLADFKPLPLNHAVLRITNISWDTTSQDILDIFQVSLDQVHIPIDRTTGKTCGDLFIELPDVFTLLGTIDGHDRGILRGRSLCMSHSAHEELFAAHFPNDILSDEEACSLINICKHYKVSSPLSRFAPQLTLDILLEEVRTKAL